MTTVEQSTPGSEVATAGHPDQGETLPLYLCPACGVEARERDRFCRRCGANQSERGAAPVVLVAAANAAAPLSQGGSLSPQVTSPLAQANTYRRVSGSLVTYLTNGVSANTAAYPINRVARRIIPALISIPIWLLIILLSPLDAYAAAKAASSQIGFR
jgi:predicted RNA-binding Zn-ribbon protein involved in translation (DUF1610 family)